MSALADRADLLEADPALAERPAAELLDRLDALRGDFQEALTESWRHRRAGERAEDAEARAEAAAGKLEPVRGSRSWRITEPLRNGGARAREGVRGALGRLRRAARS